MRKTVFSFFFSHPPLPCDNGPWRVGIWLWFRVVCHPNATVDELVQIKTNALSSSFPGKLSWSASIHYIIWILTNVTDVGVDAGVGVRGRVEGMIFHTTPTMRYKDYMERERPRWGGSNRESGVQTGRQTPRHDVIQTDIQTGEDRKTGIPTSM